MAKSKLFSSLVVTGFVFATLFGLAGCGASEPEAENEAPEAKEQVKEDILTIGEELEDVEGILFTNKTGVDISAVEIVKADSESESGDNLALSAEKWENNKDAEVFFKSEVDTKYDLKITCDKERFTLHAVDFSELTGADGGIVISMQDGIAYLQYTKDGKTVSTLDAEKAIVESESEATEEDSENDADDNGESADDQSGQDVYEEEIAYEQPAYEEPVYEEPAYQEPAYEEPAPAPEAPDQSGDQCVTDVVLN